MINAIATDLSQRVSALSPRDWVVAAGVVSLVLAIAWIGRNVSRLIEALEVSTERVHKLEAAQAVSATKAGDIETVCRNLWLRQDRLQRLALGWRDSALFTERRDSGLTVIELKKPE